MGAVVFAGAFLAGAFLGAAFFFGGASTVAGLTSNCFASINSAGAGFVVAAISSTVLLASGVLLVLFGLKKLLSQVNIVGNLH